MNDNSKMKYVVYLTTYRGTRLPPYYIGSSTEEKVLSGKYFGTVCSKKWKETFYSELKDNKHLFSVEILSTHITRQEAFDEELRLHVLNNVIKSSLFINESFAKKDGYYGRQTFGKDHPMFGKPGPNKGKIFSIEHRHKLSVSHKGLIPSQSTRDKMSDARTGKKFNIESVLKIRKSQPATKIVVQLTPDGKQICEYPSLHEAHRQTGYSLSKLSGCCNGHIKSLHGSTWKFKKQNDDEKNNDRN